MAASSSLACWLRALVRPDGFSDGAVPAKPPLHPHPRSRSRRDVADPARIRDGGGCSQAEGGSIDEGLAHASLSVAEGVQRQYQRGNGDGHDRHSGEPHLAAGLVHRKQGRRCWDQERPCRPCAGHNSLDLPEHISELAATLRGGTTRVLEKRPCSSRLPMKWCIEISFSLF